MPTQQWPGQAAHHCPGAASVDLKSEPLSVMADCRSFLSATHRLANFQFESSDALLNWLRDEQNCKHKRESATGYSEDHNAMVCKKHGCPLRCFVTWCFSTQVRRALLGTRYLGVPPGGTQKPVKGTTPVPIPWVVRRNASVGFFVPFPTYAPQRKRTRRGGMYVLCLMIMNVMNLVYC